MEEVLPNSTVHTISVKNNNAIIETATAAKAFRIKDVPAEDLEVLLNKIQSKNDQVAVTFSQESNSMPNIFFLMPFLMPFLILLHIILLWVALRIIIKSAVDPMEKLVHTFISILVPFFGPLIYLTTKIE